MTLSKSRLVMGMALTLAVCGATPAPTDDLSIPARCRPSEARYNERCRDVIDARSAERNRRGNQRDAKANAALKDAILSSRTRSGETVAHVLEQVPSRIPFHVSGWSFVYARSGARYVVMSYAKEKAVGRTGGEETRANAERHPDYDLEPDPVMSLQNSSATGYVVWKAENSGFVPWGSQANMLALGSRAFTHAINQGREGFQNSGFDAAVAGDLSFLDVLPTGKGTLSDALGGHDRRKLQLYWNVVDGYTVMAPSLDCPSQKTGDFTFQGENCIEKALAEREISGRVLPFKVIRAIRNHGFVRGMVAADVSVSVQGG